MFFPLSYLFAEASLCLLIELLTQLCVFHVGVAESFEANTTFNLQLSSMQSCALEMC
jgi:hypothetical protein